MMQIPLSQGKVAIVDDGDHPWFSEFRWCYRADRNQRLGCAVRHIKVNNKDRLSYLHREIMNAPPTKEVIFLNHDSLDCQRTNLKIVSNQEACWHHRVRSDSKSGIKGLQYNQLTEKWTASITRHGVYHHLGTFRTKEAALTAYHQAEEYFSPSLALNYQGDIHV